MGYVRIQMRCVQIQIRYFPIQMKYVQIQVRYDKPTECVEVAGGTMNKVDVVNCPGQLVYSTETEQSKVLINTSALDAGTYLVKILVNNRVVTKRLSVVKQ